MVSVEEDVADPPLLSDSVPVIAEGGSIAGGTDGTGQLVAVLDTGVDASHAFLTGKVVAEACFSAGENCPNGTASQVGSGAGAPCTYACLGCRHGTHVAGIAAGLTTGLAGVARGASILSIQVFSRFTGNPCAGGENPCALSYVSDQLAALEHVYDLHTVYHIAAVNMSRAAAVSVVLATTTCARELSTISGRSASLLWSPPATMGLPMPSPLPRASPAR